MQACFAHEVQAHSLAPDAVESVIGKRPSINATHLSTKCPETSHAELRAGRRGKKKEGERERGGGGVKLHEAPSYRSIAP